jgi:hypothetical protein
VTREANDLTDKVVGFDKLVIEGLHELAGWWNDLFRRRGRGAKKDPGESGNPPIGYQSPLTEESVEIERIAKIPSLSRSIVEANHVSLCTCERRQKKAPVGAVPR